MQALASTYLCCWEANRVFAILGTACDSIACEKAIIKPDDEHDAAKEYQQAQRMLSSPENDKQGSQRIQNRKMTLQR